MLGIAKILKTLLSKSGKAKIVSSLPYFVHDVRLTSISQKLYCPFYMGELESANFLSMFCSKIDACHGAGQQFTTKHPVTQFSKSLDFLYLVSNTLLRNIFEKICWFHRWYVMYIRLSFDWKILSKLFFCCVDERIVVSKSMITPYFCDQGILGNLPKFNLRWYNCSIIWWKFLRSCNLN